MNRQLLSSGTSCAFESIHVVGDMKGAKPATLPGLLLFGSRVVARCTATMIRTSWFIASPLLSANQVDRYPAEGTEQIPIQDSEQGAPLSYVRRVPRQPVEHRAFVRSGYITISSKGSPAPCPLRSASRITSKRATASRQAVHSTPFDTGCSAEHNSHFFNIVICGSSSRWDMTYKPVLPDSKAPTSRSLESIALLVSS
jgi:hypothetical protein